MWPFKRKTVIKETRKVGLYQRRYESSSSSAWDGLSIIEKFAMIMLPIALTFIDYMITDAIFGFPKWLTACIAIGSTTLIIIALNLIVKWITERDY